MPLLGYDDVRVFTGSGPLIPAIVRALPASNRDIGSCGLGKSHPRKPLLKPRIAAQTVPLRRHGEMYERRVAAVERAIEPPECVVEIAGLGMQHRESDVGAAAGVLRPFCGAIESASCHRCVCAA